MPEASFAWPTLVAAYRNEQEERPKQGFAAALAVVAGTGYLDELIALARDPSLGTSRVVLLGALERSKESKATAALMALGTDPELHQQVQISLRKKQRRAKRRK